MKNADLCGGDFTINILITFTSLYEYFSVTLILIFLHLFYFYASIQYNLRQASRTLFIPLSKTYKTNIQNQTQMWLGSESGLSHSW